MLLVIGYFEGDRPAFGGDFKRRWALGGSKILSPEYEAV